LISWATDLFLLSWLLIRVCCRYKQSPDTTSWHFTRFQSEPQQIKVKYFSSVPTWAYVGRNSSVGIATRYGIDVQGIEYRWGARFSTPVQTDPGASYAMGIGSFPGVERPGHGVDYRPTPSSAEVKERVESYLYSPLGLRELFQDKIYRLPGRTLPLT
jgi:hypothetical protein